MKTFYFTLFVLTLFCFSPKKGWTFFVPEKGDYSFYSRGVSKYFKDHDVNYVELVSNRPLPYKLDKKTNEFQIKNWFLQDWDSLQNDFQFDEMAYINYYLSETFTEAKRKQYREYKFNKKTFSHEKVIPTMKEWGGLTHPPLKTLALPLEKYDTNFQPIDYSFLESPFFSTNLHLKLDKISDSELSFGNEVIPYTDNESFLKKKEIIGQAKKTILLSSLAFVCDSSTREIVDLLFKKLKEGVKIFVLTDGLISKVLDHKECPSLMKKGGINVILTKDFFKYQGKSIYHTKVLVVDQELAMAGGQNMLNADHQSRGTDFKNRDVDLFFKGPIVLDIAKGFIENWEHQLKFVKNNVSLSALQLQVLKKMKEERLRGQRGPRNYSEILSNPGSRMKGVCRFINQAPYRNVSSITKVYLELLERTKKYLVITDPIKSDTDYSQNLSIPLFDKFDRFVNFNELHRKVLDLPKRDVKIDYITTNIRMAGNENVAIQNEKITDYLKEGREVWANIPYLSLTLSNKFFGKPHYNNLLKDWYPIKNVRVWTHISLMHSKIFYFDRLISSIGSFNFHHNATDHAYESTAVCLDEELNQELDKILVLDLANSIPLIFNKRL